MKTGNPQDSLIAYTPLDPRGIVRDYCTRGLIVLAPDSLGISREIHDRIYKQQKRALREGAQVSASKIPDVLRVIDAPGVVKACNAILGDKWAIVPFTHNATFMSGSNDQHWHKDDNGPFNQRKHRHHQAVQAEMLYYPQAVAKDMGATATVPYSQYWTFNHEENHDNFAGADHLDFAYQISGMERIPISGPRSEYDRDDIINQRTGHDVRMRRAVEELGWPLNQPYEVGPLEAGSVVIYSHNLLHRGNHRRDDWRLWKETPRFMWRFWLYRTTEPSGKEMLEELERLGDLGIDPVTRIDRSTVDSDTLSVWRYQTHWTLTGKPLKSSKNECIEELAKRMHALEDCNEPVRVGAAYRLAMQADAQEALKVLEDGVNNDRESVRRAATYGLTAAGERSTEIFLRAANSPVRWVRKAGVFGLGEAGKVKAEVVATLCFRLLNDSSVYVRSVSASALGCLGRRAIAANLGSEHIPVIAETFCTSLANEKNRLSMDKAQGRSIKFVRPTDECDVCEGIGFDFGQERFKPVRSVVRENVLWSTVIVCSHGHHVIGDTLRSLISALKNVVTKDENVFCVGLAVDALNRLLRINTGSNSDIAEEIQQLRGEFPSIMDLSPIHSAEPLVRGGLPIELVSETQTPNVLDTVKR